MINLLIQSTYKKFLGYKIGLIFLFSFSYSFIAQSSVQKKNQVKQVVVQFEHAYMGLPLSGMTMDMLQLQIAQQFEVSLSQQMLTIDDVDPFVFYRR